ncbi:MAG TPA: hypothetical protein DEQ43_20500 [Nocardioides bacterium]|uniref:hypothetical protein n=1 Tax=uncultured Nocardioides sp. TaxID=198441 RepID=UPI000ED69EF3|nr:hypothetical protein [uncultured Nocardioides sp.]HCB06588.1 hypothetical protein [Nocardioides sp.]HRD64506.1 hypothetical protein [Nocardioides sp.]
MDDDRYTFLELDDETRVLMLAELDLDIATSGAPYLGKTLTERGLEEYQDLLREALSHGDEASLVAALEADGRVVDSPTDAARKLGRTEFLQYYIRGICRRASAHGSNAVYCYRAHESLHPRPESQVLDGQAQSAPRILANLRGAEHHDRDTGLGRANSGIAIRCGCVSCWSE